MLFVHIFVRVTLALLLSIISSSSQESHKSHIIIEPVQLGRFID